MSEVLVGRKLTRNHQVVFAVVNAMQKGEHAPAGEIYSAAKRLKSGIGYSTVYRALDRLRAMGLVSEVRVPGNSSALYEAVRESHAHFRCERCGQIDDIDYELPVAEADAVARQAGVAVMTVTLTFNGLCAGCTKE